MLARLVVILSCCIYAVSCKGDQGKCETCKKFVETFDKGLDRTEKSNFAGGDTKWEERNRLTYANSEVRLVEVLDRICTPSDYHCSNFLEANEEAIEKWWLKLRQNGEPELLQWLCFSHLDVCCPEGTYGPKCKECPGGKDTPCNNHGTCQGAEEKDGSGKCKCNGGYRGRECGSCKDGYYEEEKECRKCDKACEKICNGSGAASCEKCAAGYKREEDGGSCEDVDECEEDTTKCGDGTYCHNTPGSFKCEPCDKSCKSTCSGRGSKLCDECAEGYKNTSGFCLDINECKEGLADCPSGTFCDNSPGSFKCSECHESCESTCSNGRASGCDACKTGYTMVNGSCEDANECDDSPCATPSEICSNTVGSYTCKCNAGYTRVGGVCETWEKAEKLRDEAAAKKEKKKKKKAKGRKSKLGKEEKTEAIEEDQQLTEEVATPPSDESNEAPSAVPNVNTENFEKPSSLDEEPMLSSHEEL